MTSALNPAALAAVECAFHSQLFVHFRAAVRIANSVSFGPSTLLFK